jgi:L,D-peptidoglycan transpeptidase YkuD (ErfK/YbiS/YcfS/YnhG family)
VTQWRGDIVVTPAGAWFMGRRLPCVVGRGGIVPGRDKREGDGATPAGVHRLIGMLYRADRMARPADWAVPIRPFDRWSDDPADPDYNLPVTAPHPFGSERMHRPDPLYDLVILTDWNWPQAEAGRGSAIFIHRWRGPARPTAGCVAFPPDVLAWLAPRITLWTRLVVRGG